jgi:hypothetical protein
MPKGNPRRYRTAATYYVAVALAMFLWLWLIAWIVMRLI